METFIDKAKKKLESQEFRELNVKEKGCLEEIFFYILNLCLNKGELLTVKEDIPYEEWIPKIDFKRKNDYIIELTLSGLGLKKIPHQIFQLQNISYLNLSYNKIDEVPKEISELTKIQYLDLSNNSIKILPDSFVKLEYLETLFLNSNNITTPPWQLFYLNQLKMILF